MASTILRVNASDLKVSAEEVTKEYSNKWGRSLTSAVISNEVDPACDPLGPKNKVVFGVGPLAGTLVPGANRLSVGAKSPLTLGIKESNAGGTVAFALATNGVRGVVIEGMPRGPAAQQMWVLKISNGPRAELVRYHEVGERSLYGRAQRLCEMFGPNYSYAVVGPAADLRLPTALIAISDLNRKPANFASRGGLGAVLRSKGIVAVVVEINKNGSKELLRKCESREACATRRELLDMLAKSVLTAETYRKYGTASVLDVTNSVGGLPTRNFSRGRFEHASSINGEALFRTIASRGGDGRVSQACMPGCCVMCSNTFADECGKEIVSPLEYETIGLMGSNLGIGDLDKIARLNRACNDVGLDTIDMGATLGVLMDEGYIRFGDWAACLQLIETIRNSERLGRVLGAGCASVGRLVGAKRIPTVKGQAMAAYEPRGVKGLGVTYASSPMGADHTAGNTIRWQLVHSQKEGQAEASVRAQIGACTWDSLGICLFVTGGTRENPDIWTKLASLIAPDAPRTFTEAGGTAAACLKAELEFNRAAGLSTEAVLPSWCYEENNPDSDSHFDISPREISAWVEQLIYCR